MGMFDCVRFIHSMPDGFEGGNYQCKDLRYGMDMASYEVTSDGRLLRTESGQGQPLGDLLYDHTIVITGDGHSHSYSLAFKDGYLREIYCFQTDTTVPFVPVTGHTAN